MSEQYFTKRQNNLRTLFSKENLDGMLITNLTHIRYLCGFTGSAGSLLITHDKCEFITDGRYTKPFLRKKLFKEIKSANTHGTKSGQWSARKAQYLAKKYKAMGGDYY